MKVWVITGRTESGDNLGAYVLDYEPTRQEMHEIVKADWPGEYVDDNYNPLEPENYDDGFAYPELNSAEIISR